MFFVTFEPLWIKAVSPTGKCSVFVFFLKNVNNVSVWGKTSIFFYFSLFLVFEKHFRENQTIFEKYFELVNKSV